jgi:hypothetical protein
MDGKPKPLELLEPPAPESLVPHHGLWPWLAAAALVVLAAIVLTIVLRKRKPAAADAGAMRAAAFAKAAAAFSGMAADSPREAAVLASLILREYLATAAGDPALFETHEEFIARRDSLQSLTPDARAAAETGFSRLAALKYAPETPAAESSQIVADSRALLETLHHGFAA